MEIPKKIYVHEASAPELTENLPYHIEYTRTDAFIEQALKWYCLDCECNDNCKDTKCFFHNLYKRFLEGDENACPPKWDMTILNPDGSTSDNWHYRHFTNKMQNAFIEKAWSFIEDNLLTANQQDNSRKYFEQFKEAMKL